MADDAVLSERMIYHCFWIEAEPARVFSALSTRVGLAGWWTKNVEWKGTIGSVTTFRFASGAFNRMKVVTHDSGRVEWECVDGNPEWIGTTVSFEFRKDAGGVKLCFTHAGWRAVTEYMGECSFHWAHYLKSLKLYCETGIGTPNEG